MLALGVLASAGLALATWQLRRSLGLHATGRAIATAILIVVTVGGLAPVALGIGAIMRSLQARRLAAEGQAVDARIASAKATSLSWYVGGIGASVLVLAGMFWFLSTGHGVIRRAFLRGSTLTAKSGDGTVLGKILSGFALNVKIFMVAQVIILVWALLVALGRMFPGRQGAPIRFLSIVYTDVFRGFPGIVTIFLVAFGLRLAKVPFIEGWAEDTKRFWLPVIALVLVYGAYVSEVYRAGLESIHWSQMAAARSLGLSAPQTYRQVIIPQAVRRVIPPLLNDFIGLQKDTALLTLVGTSEAFNLSTSAATRLANPTPVFAAGLCFLIITIPLARVTDYLIKRDPAQMRAGG